MKGNSEASDRPVVNSALWAALGDALGFITELTDLPGLQRRANIERVTNTVEWNRRVGGRSGPTVRLPAGCYSDDTQLRLGTSRSITASGRFDVEAFAKVELPVWLCYSLRAGVGILSAASNLSNSSSPWYSNFYSNLATTYVASGGNGAAMRIQPHVWASSDKGNPDSYLLDVLRNAACTHGNLHGILGAIFHALALGWTFAHNEIPGPKVWREFSSNFRIIASLVQYDNELSSTWLPTWEESNSKSFESEITQVTAEFEEDILKLTAKDIVDGSSYKEAVESIGGLDANTRGSGLKSALLACALSWGYRDREPLEVLRVAANLFDSDTDTIATMAGALVGVLSLDEPSDALQDRIYILSKKQNA